jgi:tetratricopeptide (TPR) repeat protein
MTSPQLLVERVGWSVRDVSAAVDNLGALLCYELGAQGETMRGQLAVLRAIHDTLLTPAKTRAAERVTDAAVLLETGRYARALTLAREAIDLDPVTSVGFVAAGWALIGARRYAEARPYFEEAADASSGDQRSVYRRQAARLAYATGDTAGALELSRAVAADVSCSERLRVMYDRGIYEAAVENTARAIKTLKAVCDGDWRFGALAVADRALADYPDVQRVVVEHAAAVQRASEDRRLDLDARLRARRDDLPPRLQWLSEDDDYRSDQKRDIERLGELERLLLEATSAIAEARGRHLDDIEAALLRVTTDIAALRIRYPEAAARDKIEGDAAELRALGGPAQKSPAGPAPPFSWWMISA